MKVRIVVGGTELHLTGLTMTARQVKQLLHDVAAVALAVGETPEEEAEPAARAIGFTAHLELDEARNADPDYWYDDEE